MSEIIFDAAARNIELIVELMDIVGVHDCEELTNKVRELQKRSLTMRPADEAYCDTNCVDDPNRVGWLFCPYCGKRLRR